MGASVKLPMTLWELAILALISAGIGAGIHSAYCGRIIDDCHEVAEQVTNYGPHAAKAFEFAKCLSPRKYDPLYDYNRFKGK